MAAIASLFVGFSEGFGAIMSSLAVARAQNPLYVLSSICGCRFVADRLLSPRERERESRFVDLLF